MAESIYGGFLYIVCTQYSIAEAENTTNGNKSELGNKMHKTSKQVVKLSFSLSRLPDRKKHRFIALLLCCLGKSTKHNYVCFPERLAACTGVNESVNGCVVERGKKRADVLDVNEPDEEMIS